MGRQGGPGWLRGAGLSGGSPCRGYPTTGGVAGTVAPPSASTLTPTSMPAEVALGSSVEGPACVEVAMVEVSPALASSVIVIPDSSGMDRGKGSAGNEGAGAVEQPEASAMERTEPQPGEGSSTVVPTHRNHNEWGGPRLTWRDPAALEPAFILGDTEEMRLWQVLHDLG